MVSGAEEEGYDHGLALRGGQRLVHGGPDKVEVGQAHPESRAERADPFEERLGGGDAGAAAGAVGDGEQGGGGRHESTASR
ncbi:hypothetical protein GCM10020000_00670 [Streptomyces olivoverticillatus]